MNRQEKSRINATIIQANVGRFFTVQFEKISDGEGRKINCRLGCLDSEGKPAPYIDKNGNLLVKVMSGKGKGEFCSIKPETIYNVAMLCGSINIR